MKMKSEGFSNLPAVLEADRRAAANLVPPPDMLPSVWAEGDAERGILPNVKIPIGNAIPGPINFDNAPMQRGILNAVKEVGVRRLDLMLGAQLGKTTVLQVLTGYFIKHEPRSQIMAQPSEGDMATFQETKLKPMLEANPSISALMAKPRGRQGVNNSRMISYVGGWLMFSWAGSPKTARGRSAPVTQQDEIDGYDVTPEGDFSELLSQRSATFGDDRLDIRSSTPVELETSRIYKGFLAGDRRRYHVRCPHCDHIQYFKWENVDWNGRQSTGIKDAEKDVAEGIEHDPASALYRCDEPTCGTLWNDGERVAAIRRAEKVGAGWIAERPFKGHASFHAPEMASTFRRLRDIVQSYLDKMALGDLQTFVNVSLGWPFAAGEKADPDGLYARREQYAARVPMGGLWLSCGVDMQMDRLEYEVVAWGIGEESWSIQTGILWGDPLTQDVWDDLEDVIDGLYEHESGARLPVSATIVDTGGTGGMTAAAYAWLQGKTGRRIFGGKGIPGWGRPIAVKPTRKRVGKKAAKYADLVQMGVDEAKLVLQRRLAISVRGPGFCHFPQDEEYNEDFFKQITAERLVTRYVKGQPVREWHKNDKDRAEKLDCRVYAYVGLKLMQPSFKRLAARLGVEDMTKDEPHDTEGEQPQAETPPAPAQRRPARPPREVRKPQEKPPEDAKTPKAETTVLKRPKRAASSRRGGWATNW